MYGLCLTLFIVSATATAVPQPAAKSDTRETVAFVHKSLPRLHLVREGLYRGGQPKEGGFEILQAQGIRTVINLRHENEEQAVVEGLGMQYFHIPLSAWKGVPDAAVREFFGILSDSSNYPVFVHCQRGADRTGAMIALYRIAYQSWSGEQAYKEARKLGMRWWYFNLKRLIRNFDPAPFSASVPRLQLLPAVQ